jgi:SAM-dependent methyltransferase
MENVTINYKKQSFYEEPNSKAYCIKRKISLRPILKLIRRYIKSPSIKLLEIGTGSGYLLSFLEVEYPEACLIGIEYDERLVAIAKNRVKKAKIICQNAELFAIDNEQFDIIVSCQVIEHLFNPERMLISVKKHLKPKGIFILTTPNKTGIGARIMKKKWHGYRSDHVSLKGFEAWEEVIQESGFHSIYCGSTFFSGIPILNTIPFGIINWLLLYFVGFIKWNHGESFVGVFENDKDA